MLQDPHREDEARDADGQDQACVNDHAQAEVYSFAGCLIRDRVCAELEVRDHFLKVEVEQGALYETADCPLAN
jgi:hypothetical protein